MTDERKAAMAAMVDSWYWQVQEQGKWRYKYHTEVLVRYYELAPLEAEVFHDVMVYLEGLVNITSLQLHGKIVALDGVWDTNRVWYETREGDTSESNKLKRVRIYHALVKDCGNVAADGPYTVENGCRWNVTHKFYWNVPQLPTLPTSSSGVNYQMQGVTRDQETGLFSCVVEKRERVRQDVAQYTTEKTVFEQRDEEAHLGVKQNQVPTTGKAASVDGGVLVQRKITKNEDCTSDVQNVTIVEEPVNAAVVEKRVTLHGNETTVINRNQPNKADDANLAPGQSVRNELTPGGRWNQTITTFVAKALGWVRRTCRATIFEERDSVTSVTATDPGFTHCTVSLGEGKVKEITVTRTEDNAFEVEESTIKEKRADAAVTVVEKDLEGITITTTDRNAAAPGDFTDLKVGESVRTEVTEGGKFNVTKRTVGVNSIGTRVENEQQGPLETVTRKIVNQASPGDGVKNAEVSKIVSAGNTLTPRGSYDYEVVEREAHEKQAQFSGGTQKRKLKGYVTRNTQDEINEPNPAVNQSIEVSESINEFGLKDIVKRVTTYEEQTAIVRSGSSLVDVTFETHENATNKPDDDVGDNGKVVDITCQQNDRGSYDWRKTTRMAKMAQVDNPLTWQTQDDNYNYNHELQVYRNSEKPMVPGKGSYANASVSFSINEFGLYDGHYVTTSKTKIKNDDGKGGGDSKWEDDTEVNGYIYFQKADGSLWRTPYSAHLYMLYSTMKAMIQACKGGESCRPLGWVTGIQNGVAFNYSNIRKTGNAEKM